ncbi:segregation and condensation protein A [Leptospira sp. GIMC2001]|uniref:segregation and condensation protein A n=1 Tax=Leptospira sp. GIMC2001 TaxID=1513297 RepID=UPI0004A5C45A|nr:segregation/condensation protein A [Leptospira sp. GIMC2001]AID56270.1 segregation and condensation protein A [Leptospira sp. GIMC2001]WCL48900.1 segregation/condensation protein A [Leptospira sp. GIMC2001]
MAEHPDSFIVRWNNSEGGVSEGPLNVLWSLIDSYRVDIFDVSLTRITNDFINFIKTADSISLDLSSEFALMAANLIYLKSRALLPDPGFEEEDYNPPLPKELVEKLLEHKKFQMAAGKLSQLDKITSGMFTRDSNVVLADDDKWLDLSLVDLISAFNSILNKEPENEEEPLVYEGLNKNFSVEDKMELIEKSLASKGEIIFSEIFESDSPEKQEIVAGFLAVLEVVKIRVARVVQHQVFGTIKLIAVNQSWKRTESI